jgi:hypothetical protein
MRREYEAEEEEWWEEEKARRKTRRPAPARTEGADQRPKQRPRHSPMRRREPAE